MQHSVQLYWALAAACPIAAAYALYRLFASISRDRFVTDTPQVKIRSAAQGYVRVAGHAGRSAADIIAAPLSGRPCVWWDYRVAVRETDSRGNSTWNPLENATSITPFTLIDDLGDRCLVGPVGAEVTPTDSDTWYGDTPRPVAGPTPNSWLGSQEHTYRYTERLLGQGTPLSVLGELRSHAQEREVDGEARALLSGWKEDQPGLLARFDQDHDGRIDPAEWEAARAAARSQAQVSAADARIERASIIVQPSHGQPFLIAPLDARRLAYRERRNAWLFLVAAVLLVALSAWSVHKLRQQAAAVAAQAPPAEGG